MTKLGRPSIPPLERKAEFITLRLSPSERNEIDEAAKKEGAPATQWARAILLAKNHENLTMKIKLNETELEILYRQDPSQKGKGGWQQLLVRLQELINEQTCELELSPVVLERIRRYAFDYSQGGWEDRLKGIFERTLGPRLDGNI